MKGQSLALAFKKLSFRERRGKSRFEKLDGALQITVFAGLIVGLAGLVVSHTGLVLGSHLMWISKGFIILGMRGLLTRESTSMR